MKREPSLGVFYFDNRPDGYFLGAFGDDVSRLPSKVRNLNEKDKLLLFEAMEKVYAMGKRHGKS